MLFNISINTSIIYLGRTLYIGTILIKTYLPTYLRPTYQPQINYFQNYLTINCNKYFMG
jgi:hypothetical protein